MNKTIKSTLCYLLILLIFTSCSTTIPKKEVNQKNSTLSGAESIVSTLEEQDLQPYYFRTKDPSNNTLTDVNVKIPKDWTPLAVESSDTNLYPSIPGFDIGFADFYMDINGESYKTDDILAGKPIMRENRFTVGEELSLGSVGDINFGGYQGRKMEYENATNYFMVFNNTQELKLFFFLHDDEPKENIGGWIQMTEKDREKTEVFAKTIIENFTLLNSQYFPPAVDNSGWGFFPEGSPAFSGIQKGYVKNTEEIPNPDTFISPGFTSISEGKLTDKHKLYHFYEGDDYKGQDDPIDFTVVCEGVKDVNPIYGKLGSLTETNYSPLIVNGQDEYYTSDWYWQFNMPPIYMNHTETTIHLAGQNLLLDDDSNLYFHLFTQENFQDAIDLNSFTFVCQNVKKAIYLRDGRIIILTLNGEIMIVPGLESKEFSEYVPKFIMTGVEDIQMTYGEYTSMPNYMENEDIPYSFFFLREGNLYYLGLPNLSNEVPTEEILLDTAMPYLWDSENGLELCIVGTDILKFYVGLTDLQIHPGNQILWVNSENDFWINNEKQDNQKWKMGNQKIVDMCVNYRKYIVLLDDGTINVDGESFSVTEIENEIDTAA